MAPHLRRQLSEEGKKLLRRALAHEDEDLGSVDDSVVTNRDDASAESDLESVLEWELQNGGANGGSDVASASAPKTKHAHAKWKAQRYGNDTGRDENLESAIDELAEKRDATKVHALQKILSMLCGSVMTYSVQPSKVALTSNVLACLKKRMKDSGALALRSLGVLAITIGSDEQAFFDDVRMPLQRIVTDDGDVSLRVEALYALSTACFVCCREDQQKWELIDVLGHLLVASKDAEDDGDDAHPESLIVAAMECWAFLVSFFRPSLIVSKLYDENAIIFDHVTAVAGFVRDGANPAVRSAACEVLALLVQLKYALSPGWSYALESRDSVVGGLEAKIERFLKETGKNIGKKTRKTQRSLLKEVLETLRTGDGPHQELQVDDETLSVSTWSCFFQAHVFRRTLQSGFQVHMVKNPVLRAVFDVSDKVHVRASMVPTTKRRADHKSKAVHKRNEVSRKDLAQNAFLYEE
ncbi:hypothetical protein PybrP1_005135 [[Pythium] brassicae (nom. inval.)]|nr:hypothetical protein PybrP1_005135 [[Pythium] brassicae (nom. inval.)]